MTTIFEGFPKDFDDPKEEWLPYDTHFNNEFWVPLIFTEHWSPLPPTSPPKYYRHPVNYVRFVCTNTSQQKHPSSVQAIQVYQKFHMIMRQLPNMPYNFLIDDEGVAYEMVGWHADVWREKELDWLKGDCMDFAYIGDFREKDPPWEMQRAALELIRFGIKKNVISPTFQVIPFRNV